MEKRSRLAAAAAGLGAYALTGNVFAQEPDCSYLPAGSSKAETCN
jgi:hypothetical protein